MSAGACGPYCVALPTTSTAGSSTPALRRCAASESTRTAPSTLTSKVAAGASRAVGMKLMPARWKIASGALRSTARCTMSPSRISPCSHSTDDRSDGVSTPAGGSCSPSATTRHPSSSSACASHCPTKPLPPVTSAFRLTMAGRDSPRGRVAPKIRFDHHLDELLESHVWFPPEYAPRLAGVGDEQVHLSGPEEALVLHHVIVVIKADVAECDLAELPDRPRPSGADHVIVRRVLLEHEPHGTDVVSREPPISSCFEVAETQIAREAEFDACHAVGHLPRHELESTARALVIEENAG